MPFRSDALAVLGYANGFTLWSYQTTDDRETVLGDHYFNPGHLMLRAGDLLLVTCRQPDGDARTGLALVAQIRGGGVLVTPAGSL